MGQLLRAEWRRRMKILVQKEIIFSSYDYLHSSNYIVITQVNSSGLLRLYKSAAVTVTLTLDNYWIALQQS